VGVSLKGRGMGGGGGGCELAAAAARGGGAAPGVCVCVRRCLSLSPFRASARGWGRSSCCGGGSRAPRCDRTAGEPERGRGVPCGSLSSRRESGRRVTKTSRRPAAVCAPACGGAGGGALAIPSVAGVSPARRGAWVGRTRAPSAPRRRGGGKALRARSSRSTPQCEKRLGAKVCSPSLSIAQQYLPGGGARGWAACAYSVLAVFCARRRGPGSAQGGGRSGGSLGHVLEEGEVRPPTRRPTLCFFATQSVVRLGS
jgi:hypothetical protein